jgi:two-component system, OmpR family, sensor kinase
MTKLSLASYFIFIVILLSVLLTISYYLIMILPLTLSILIIILLTLATATWMVKLLFAPLLQASQNIDDIIKETLHELNIPIATIEANASMILKKLEDTKQQKQLSRIIQSSSHLLYLHKRLKYLLKKEFHQVTLEDIKLDDFIQTSVLEYQTLYPKANFELDLSTCTIHSDFFGLKQVLDNIISNAIKYADTTPNIKITLKEYTLEIIDHGKGMDENTILQIYQRYYQADEKQTGEGIGLSVVKNFCDTYKIRLSISSELGEFTKVVLQFQQLK